MGLSLRGQTSGAVDINAPAVAGDNTITLPDGNGSANQFYKNSTTAGIVTHSSMVEDANGNVTVGGAFSLGTGTSISSPSSNVLTLGTNDTEALRITANGGVGVNTTTVPAGVNVAVGGTVRVIDTTDATQYLTINHQGINFQNTGAGSSTTVSAHILDDYEEGTWTVTCENGVTVYSGNDLASYTKIGRKVTVTGQFRVNSSNSGAALVIAALPFACSPSTENEFLSVGTVRVYQGGIRGTAVQVICVGSDGTDDLYFNEVRDNASDQAVATTNDAFYMFTFTYFTA